MKNDINNINEIKIKGIKSVKWVFLGNVLNIVLKPLVTVLLARLLVPQDFGIMGIATLVISFADIFQNMGLGQALVQREGDVSLSANVVFWSGLAFGIVVYVILFATAPLMAVFFNEPGITNVIRVVGIQVIINAFATVQFALLQRNFDFQKLFMVRLSSLILSSVLSITLAFMGYGYWSLIWGTLAGSAASVLVAWQKTQFRPVFSFDLPAARQLLKFGFFVMFSSIQAWVFNYGDNTVVGRLIGVRELGIYAMGFNLMTLLVWAAPTQLTSIAFASFSRLQNNFGELRNTYCNITKLIVLVSLPIAAGLSLMAAPVVSTFFGPKWEGLEKVLRIFAIMPGLGFMWGLNSELYKAINRPDIMPKVNLATIAYIIPVYLLVAPHGLIPFCFARASVGLVFGPVHIWVCSRILGLPKSYVWNYFKFEFLAVFVMSLTVLAVLTLFELLVLKITLGVLLGAGIYCALVWLLDRDTVKMLFRTIKHAI